MRERRRRLLTLLACVTLLTIVSGVHVRAAAADDGDPTAIAQTVADAATSTATNDNATTQIVNAVQVGSGGTGQSQTVAQSAPTAQTAHAIASSVEHAAGVGDGGPQGNSSSAGATASNTNATNQASDQHQSAAGAASTPGAQSADGQSQSAHQSASTTQTANAAANSAQIAPTNVNVVVRVGSPGDDGPVTQTNTSTAVAGATNANATAQAGSQVQEGTAPAGDQSQTATQAAPTMQTVDAVASSQQIAPTNVNIVIRNKSPGHGAGVTQTNSSSAAAMAANANVTTQDASQTESAASAGSGTQSQTLVQNAPTTQSASASGESVATSTNGGAWVSVAPAATDPNGSGALGTLIQIWLPYDPAAQSAPTSSTSTASAQATSANPNETTQIATQVQTAGDDPTQSGGSSQAESIVQTVVVDQVATAQAIAATASTELGDVATAAATSLNSTSGTQVADQAQVASDAGALVQVIEQSALPGATGAASWVEIGDAIAQAGASAVSIVSIVETTGETQVGASVRVGVIVQGPWPARRAPRLRRAHPRSGAVRAVWVPPTGAPPTSTLWSKPTQSDDGATRAPARPTKRRSQNGTPPPHDDPTGLGATTGAGAGGATSLWTFAALLLPFALALPLGLRRHRSSAIRRLMSVVSRPERPG